MKHVWKYLLAGIAVAIGGMFVSDIAGNFFNGMDYGSACALGIGMYLCVVLVTCTGIIVTKLNQSTHAEKPPEDQSNGSTEG